MPNTSSGLGIFLFDATRDITHLTGYWLKSRTLYEYQRPQIHPRPTLSFKEVTTRNLTPTEEFSDPSTRNWFATYITDEDTNRSFVCGNPVNATVEDTPNLILHPLLHYTLFDWQSTEREYRKFLDRLHSHLWGSREIQGKLSMIATFENYKKMLLDDSEMIHTLLEEVSAENLGRLKPGFEKVLSRIERSKDRIEKFSSSLVSAMSIRESKKAISEAESVSRLTELAFFFIPLSFATSIFGMQIPVSFRLGYPPTKANPLSRAGVRTTNLICGRCSQHLLFLGHTYLDWLFTVYKLYGLSQMKDVVVYWF